MLRILTREPSERVVASAVGASIIAMCSVIALVFITL